MFENSNLAASIRYSLMLLENTSTACMNAHLTTCELGTDVNMASGSPNPTKYGQLLST